MPTVLAFDIGIRNLAWCLLETAPAPAGAPAQPKPAILGWQNYDLLTGAGHETVSKARVTCSKCSNTGVFMSTVAAEPTCLRHCPAERPALRDLSGNPLKKIPAPAVLKALLQARGAAVPKKPTKATLVEALRAHVSFPIEKVKLKKAVEHELTTIHDAIRTFVLENAALFRKADAILLENQPVLKNPTMKTVQILLFATLRDVLQPSPPPLKLVHAGKKVAGKATGDAGYKSRKDASEEKVLGILKSGGVDATAAGPEWLTRFSGAAKRSDLADAFCMCWDWLGLAAAAAPAAAPAPS